MSQEPRETPAESSNNAEDADNEEEDGDNEYEDSEKANCPGVSLYERCYRGSVKTYLSSHFEDYKALIRSSMFHKHYEIEARSFLAKVMGDEVDEERLGLLEEHCSVDNLTVAGELPRMNKRQFEWREEVASGTLDLQTIKYTKRRNLLKNYQVQAKYRSERPVIYESVPPEEPDRLLTPENDIIVYVRVYLPFTSRSKVSSGALGKLSVNSVIAILGSQTLDKLRDLITCESDYSISVEMSEAPTKYKTENAKEVYKSGFIFIEDTFYNDFRDPSNKDNSEVIREWAEKKKLGNYKTAKMEETRVDSLNLRFGFPWVYQHQGDCEHLISFSDARLVNQDDELNASSYPRIVRIKPRPNRYCMTCGLYNVSWITTSNDRLPHNPCLFCDSCFKSYNYVKGEKIGKFEAYPYPYDNSLRQLQTKKAIRRSVCSTVVPAKRQASQSEVECKSKNVSKTDE